jgi:hypothetical protein
MLIFNLAVTNRSGVVANSSCIVNVSATDNAPMANAGADQTVIPHTIVTLDGTGSSDPNGTIPSYSWIQIQWPHV